MNVFSPETIYRLNRTKNQTKPVSGLQRLKAYSRLKTSQNRPTYLLLLNLNQTCLREVLLDEMFKELICIN